MSSVLGKRKQYDSESIDDDGVPQHKRHKSGHHKPCAPPNYIYRDLEVVWARLEDFPWWPAQCDFTLLDGDKGENRTPRLPVRWFGEDHNRVDWLTRDRIIPFSLEIETDLVLELKVEDEDQPEYIASIEDAVARQKKWKKDLEKERRQNKESDDEDFDPNAYKQTKRKLRAHNNNGTMDEDDDDDDDCDDDEEDDEEDNFEVDEHGVIIDPDDKTKRKRRKRHQLMIEQTEDIMDKEERDSDDVENQDIDLFDDVGDVEKGYIENADDDENNESFVVLNDNTIYEQQQNEERLKQMQIQQEEQERQRQLEIQRQQQYLIQQQQIMQYPPQNNYNEVNITNVVNYNGAQYDNYNNNHNYYEVNQEMVQPPQQAVQQMVEDTVEIKERNKKKKKHEMEEVYKASDPAKMSVEEILKNNEFALKLKEITQQNEENRASGSLDKMNKAPILKSLPYQLQQEIMMDNYVNKTPRILVEYFAHQNDANHDNTQYYPQHFMRMKEKAKKDCRISNALRKPKKRTIRTSGDNEKKKAPAYLRVASPEVLEKMHFDKQNRNALTLDHIITKQYKNRGRKSGFFGSRNRYKPKSDTKQENKKMDKDNNDDKDINVNVNNIDHDKNGEQKEGSITPQLKSVSLTGDKDTEEIEKQLHTDNKDIEKTDEWTKTKAETGEKEEGLHREDREDIGGMELDVNENNIGQSKSINVDENKEEDNDDEMENDGIILTNSQEF